MKLKKIVFANLILCFILIIFCWSAKPVFASEISNHQLMNYINLERSMRNISPLKFSHELSQAAIAKGQDMIRRDYFEHNAPYGKPWNYFLLDSGYDYVFAGENLAMDFKTSEGVHYALMQSPPHRDNIIDPRFNETGIGVIKGQFADRETTVVVELFGVRKGSSLIRPFIKQAINSLQTWLSF